jgi:hypothetical protein
MDYRSLFLRIDSFLAQNEAFWRYQPFIHVTASPETDFPWQGQCPPLSDFLDSLSMPDIEKLRSDNQRAIQDVALYFPGLSDVVRDSTFPLVRSPANWRFDHLPLDFRRGIPGRKLEQIEAMVKAVTATESKGTQWLEWCAGKGYLGRLLAQTTKKHVVSFEYQSDLCQAGADFAQAHGLAMSFIQGDVLRPSTKQAMPPQSHALALHACGDLHVKLIQYGTELKLPALSIVPCCYHLIQSDRYIAMSAEGRQAQLQLSQAELRIPLQETVTGGQRVKRHRQLEMIYRLGVDLIYRHQFGDHDYKPLPSIKKSMLANGFGDFLDWAAAYHQRRIEDDIDVPTYYAQAERKFHQMEKIALVQQQFYSLLEAWIVLDKVLFLQQKGYQVHVEQFCAKPITPRNLLIQARLR